MRALSFDRYGPPEVVSIIAVPPPVPQDFEVLVRVHATCVTRADSAARLGNPFAIRLVVGLPHPRQRILGTEFAGVIEAVGVCVTRFAVGERVVAASGAAFGAHAELVAVPEDGALAVVPATLKLTHALAICEGGLTALPFLRDLARLQPGQRILINGASGSVGSAAVQIARIYGADVTAVCSAPNSALVLSLGAHRVIDYSVDDFTRGAESFDVIFDAVGTSSFARSRRVLKGGGIYLTTVPGGRILVDMLVARLYGGRRATLALTGLRSPAAKRADLAWLNERAREGDLRAVIDSQHTFELVTAAYHRVDSGHKRGTVILRTQVGVNS